MILSDELELTIVGTILRIPEQIGETLSKLTPADFTGLGARTLFSAIGKLFLAGKPVDPLSVVLEAGEDCQAVVDLILDKHLYTFELDYYCQQLRERSRLRDIKALGQKLTEAESTEGAEAVLAQLNGAFASRRDAKVVSVRDAAVAFVDKLSGEDRPKYLPWGMKRLDEELFVELGDFVVIGGYASSGKTLLSLQVALMLAEAYRVGYFSLETSTRKLTDRLIAHRAGLSLKKLKRRELAQADFDAVAKATTTLDALHLDLIQAGGMSVTDIQAISLQRRYQVIVVDYLQLVEAPGRDRYEKVTAISIGLHTLAQTHGVTVVALAQLTRPERMKTKDGKPIPPGMTSFRESGQIEQDADVAMLLYPKDPEDNGSNRILKVSKNKDGEKLSLELAFDGATQTLTPVSDDKEIMRKLVDQGRKVKQQLRQTVLPEFHELSGEDSDLPF